MRFSIAFLSAWLAVAPAFAACTLPPSVSTEVGRGQTFTGGLSSLSVLGNGVRQYLWYNSSGSGAPTGVHEGLYIAGDRTPYIYSPYDTRTLSWYKTNHPDWIVYRPDRKTPAWEFCPQLDGSSANCVENFSTPLAIWDTNVQSYLEGADVSGAVSAGYFDAISVDNISTANVFYRAGTCSVAINPAVGDCAANGGTWTNRYNTAHTTTTASASSGTKILTVASCAGFVSAMNIQIRNNSGTSPAFDAGTVNSCSGSTLTLNSNLSQNVTNGAVIEAAVPVPVADHANGWYSLYEDWDSWLGALKTYVNASPRNLCLTGNITWRNYDRTNWVNLTSDLDIVYEESGFTTNSISTDVPGGGTWQDANWINKISDFQTINKPFVLQASNTTNYISRRPRIIYGLASYLLIKNNNSYQRMTSTGTWDTLEEYEPYTYWVHGTASGAMANIGGVYYRDFANGKVILNPSSTTSYSYNLGASTYHTSDGLRWTGTVNLAPRTAMVLQSGAPSTGFVLVH